MLQIISQGQETLVEATDTLQTAQETLTDIQTLFDENGLVWQSSEGVKPGNGEVKPDGHRKLKQRDP